MNIDFPRIPRVTTVAAQLIYLLALLAAAPVASAGEAKIAVAANFAAAVKDISVQFEKMTGHHVLLSFGATGQLYTQITQGAPFDVFLAADKARPARTVDDGLAVRGSQFTYATGRLVLFSRDPSYVLDGSTLVRGNPSRIAIANPVTAPYGMAAVATMKSLGIFEAVKARLVRGANIAQAYQFVYTGNAEIGFVAHAQIAGHTEGSRWIVPADLHPAIAQDAVLLKHGERNPAARAFLIFLNGRNARHVKEKYGYGAGTYTNER